MEFSLPVNVAQDSGKAEILLYRPIGANYSNGIDGAAIAEHIAYLDSLGVKEITFRINSYGGSVIDGMSILAAMQNSKAKIRAVVDGIAASIASVILLGADKAEIVDYGLVMSHRAHIPGSSAGDSDSEILKRFNASILAIYARRLGKNPEDVADLMPAGSDRWMNAQEALERGFVNAIIKTKARDLASKAQAILSDAKYLDQEDLAEVVNLFTPNEKPKKPMKDVLNALALAEGADEAAVVAAISALRSERDALTAKVTESETVVAGLQTEVTNKQAQIEDLQAKVTAFQVAETERVEREALAIVDKAIADRKITAESREKWIGLAKANLETTKEILASISVNPRLSEVTKLDDEQSKTFKGKSVEASLKEIEARVAAQKD